MDKVMFMSRTTMPVTDSITQMGARMERLLGALMGAGEMLLHLMRVVAEEVDHFIPAGVVVAEGPLAAEGDILVAEDPLPVRVVEAKRIELCGDRFGADPRFC
jgi:hypothetical protein